MHRDARFTVEYTGDRYPNTVTSVLRVRQPRRARTPGPGQIHVGQAGRKLMMSPICLPIESVIIIKVRDARTSIATARLFCELR